MCVVKKEDQKRFRLHVYELSKANIQNGGARFEGNPSSNENVSNGCQERPQTKSLGGLRAL